MDARRYRDKLKACKQAGQPGPQSLRQAREQGLLPPAEQVVVTHTPPGDQWARNPSGSQQATNLCQDCGASRDQVPWARYAQHSHQVEHARKPVGTLCYGCYKVRRQAQAAQPA